ncbi:MULTISPECIES: PilZ domain-containing protein [unclassified Novosphingobium]|uniref:PilZ domain-containing protein n=1 Tax=unclassified Novosphingobium TaxID=2644732 RepID=UPI001357DC8F|nr:MULTISPECIES: PilZ domain-containing protein [unclassified Novosphingobium]
MADLDKAGADGSSTGTDAEWLKTAALRTPRVVAAEGDVEGQGERPHRSPRVRTLIRAVIGGEGRSGQDVIVRNVSPGGMCIASRTMQPTCGETLRVALPGQVDLKAEVRWVGDGEFGVQLLGGLDVGLVQSTNRRRNAGFAAALERLLGVRPHRERTSSGLRPC